MQMTELEVTELKQWLDEAHKKRMEQIAEYKNIHYSPMVFEMGEIDYYGCDIASSEQLHKLVHPEEKNIEKHNKSASLIKSFFRKKVK